MSTTLLDVAAVRARFSALDRPLAFFDGPGGTQCPDEVIDAIARYLREDNANVGAPYETSRRTDALVAAAHDRAASFLGCDPGEVAFGQSMTSLNFLLTRALARELESGDEVLVTRLDHDGNVAPWLALAEDIGVVVRFVDVHDDLSLDLDDLAASSRTGRASSPSPLRRTPSAPRPTSPGSSSSRTRPARSPGSTPSTTAPHGPIDVAAWGCDVLICSPYKFFGPHMGVAFGRERAAAELAAVQGAPRGRRAASGAASSSGRCQHELLAGFVAAVDYVDSLGWDAIVAYERSLGERFLDGLPEDVVLHGLPTMQGRVPTFCFSIPEPTAESVAMHLGIAGRGRVVGQLLRPRDDAAPRPRRGGRRRARRDRPLQHGRGGRPAARRARGARVRLLLLGGPKFLGRA